VFDTGPQFPSGFDAGKSVVVPFLESRGVKTIDALVVSHGHNDHAGGYPAIDSEMEIRRKYFGGSSPPADTGVCVAGTRWEWDDVEFQFLWPYGNSIGENNGSCVLRISSDRGSLLLTGDIELDAEKELADNAGPALKSDVLQVPHQGSRTSSSDAFLSAVRPDYALYSTGYLSRYGHPHPEVLSRYRAMGVRQLNTATHGAITVLFAGQQSVASTREHNRGYWFEKGNQ
jgi:competence protein ComEC